MSKYLAVTGVEKVVVATIPPEAYTIRDTILAKAKTIVEITSKEDIEEAVARISVLKGLTKGVEDARKELTAPLLEGQRTLKAVADKFVIEPNAEIKRIESLISKFHEAETNRLKAERERVEAENLKARQAEAELARAQREKEAAAERERALREQAETAKKAGDRKRLEQEAEVARQEKEAAEIREDEIGFSMPATPAAHVPAPSVEMEISGATVREGVLEVEVTDLKALIQFALNNDRLFDFFKLEPRLKNIKDYITFQRPEGGTIPGVKAEKKMKVNARAANSFVALEG